MKFKHYIIFGLILIGIFFLFEWRMSVMQEKLMKSQSEMYSNMNNNFRQLSDSLSAKSKIEVVEQPGWFDKLFNTALEKQYDEIRKQIPRVIAEEIKKVKLENKYTTINKSLIEIRGDSAIFRNEDGVVLKTAKVMPLGNDSSMLVIVPQEIEVLNVTVQPDENNRDSLHVFLSAYNRTTGDTLKVSQSTTYVLPGTKKRWTFNAQPYIASTYVVGNNEVFLKGGICPIQYKDKKITAHLAGIELYYGLKNTPGIELQLIQLQLNKKKK